MEYVLIVQGKYMKDEQSEKNKAIDKVHDYLLTIEKDTFDEILKEHEHGDISTILRETGALNLDKG
jgi:hypothetical protein